MYGWGEVEIGGVFCLFCCVVLFKNFLIVFSSYCKVKAVSSLLLFCYFVGGVKAGFKAFSLPFLFLLFFKLCKCYVPVSMVYKLSVNRCQLSCVSA